ncbi:MAG: hypothetical protein ACK4NX_01090, partial [Candidatus Paceibacteria bacterium]
ERLVQEGMIDAENDIIDEKGEVLMLSAKKFIELDKGIAKLESLDYPTADAIAMLEQLSAVRNVYRERLESQIAERQQEIAARREEIKNKVLEHYAERTAELERTIAEIESNPRVIERLQMMAEKEMKEWFARREREKQEAAARIERERNAIIQEATRCIQSLGARQSNAFKRLVELTGNEKIVDELLQALGEAGVRKQQRVFDKVRSHLINAIIDGEGEKQLKDPKEIVPWKVGPTSIPYRDAIDFLRFHETEKALQAAAEAGNERAKKLLEQREQIIRGHEVIRRLVGPQWITDRRTNERRMGAFWAAFETRERNDKEGITAARKRERQEAAKREAALQKSIEEIIARGGFVVEVPIVRVIGGKKVIVGEARVAIRLEKRRSPERIVGGKKKGGNEYWVVVEVVGVPEEITRTWAKGYSVGDTSTLNMRHFDIHIREAARSYFAMHGEDFVERIMYEGKE